MTERTCTVEDCGRRHYAKSYCRKHHQQWLRTGSPTGTLRQEMPEVCTIEGCGRGGHIRRGWCGLHYDRWYYHGDPLWTEPSNEERFWASVDKNGPIPGYAPHLGPCWIWTGSISEAGYGRFNADGKLALAHRWGYIATVGPIPDGLQLDHLCRTTACVNPAHLEPVTGRENLLRGRTFQAANAAKTHCPADHPYDEANTYNYRGRRRCKACEKAKNETPEKRAANAGYTRAYKERKRQEATGLLF